MLGAIGVADRVTVIEINITTKEQETRHFESDSRIHSNGAFKPAAPSPAPKAAAAPVTAARPLTGHVAQMSVGDPGTQFESCWQHFSFLVAAQASSVSVSGAASAGLALLCCSSPHSQP